MPKLGILFVISLRIVTICYNLLLTLQWILHDPQGQRTPIVADGSEYAGMIAHSCRVLDTQQHGLISMRIVVFFIC
jgi:hypothetical protein